MKKTIIILSLVLLFGASLLYAGSGDLSVVDNLTVGGTLSVAGDVNITGPGNFKINGVSQTSPTLIGALSGLAIANDATYPNTKINVTANYIGTVFPSGTIGIDCTQYGQAGGNDLDRQTYYNGTYYSLQPGTWYYIWVIYNGTSVAGLASISSSSPAMPANYTGGQKRLVGVAVTDSSSHFKVFVQQGNHFVYDSYQQVSTGASAQNWTVQNCAAFIPPISTMGYFQVYAANGGASPSACYLRKNENGSTTSTTAHHMATTASIGAYSTTTDWINTDSNQAVQLYQSIVINVWSLRVLGFELNF